jgi:hypothetical protein
MERVACVLASSAAIRVAYDLHRSAQLFPACESLHILVEPFRTHNFASDIISTLSSVLLEKIPNVRLERHAKLEGLGLAIDKLRTKHPVYQLSHPPPAERDKVTLRLLGLGDLSDSFVSWLKQYFHVTE